MRFHPVLTSISSLATILFAFGGCSSGGAGTNANPSDGGSGHDATTSSGDDGSVPVGDDDTGDDDGGLQGDQDAISIQPPIDDADTPVTDAGPGGPWIAFASSRAGNFDIYLVHPDGTDLHAIVQRPGTDLSPAWSPDGTRIAFESNATDAGGYQIFIVNVASGVITQLATGQASAVSPAWSPDGNLIAFGGAGGLFVVASTGGTATPLTTGTFRDNSPVWAPNGATVYFSTNREASGAFDVWSVHPDGGALTQVTTGTNILGGPALSPDGGIIALAQTGAGSSTQIVFYDVGAKTSAIFSGQSDSEPSFASSGTKLAVTSTRYAVDNPEIVVMGIPGATSPFRLTDSAGVDGQGSFQPGQ